MNETYTQPPATKVIKIDAETYDYVKATAAKERRTLAGQLAVICERDREAQTPSKKPTGFR